MADTGRTVWADGLWAEDLWAAGLWASDELVEVPDVEGETQTSGTTTLETALFGVAVNEEYSSTVPVGSIISQTPSGGSFAASGSTVTITVSLGPRRDEGGSAKRPRRKRYLVEIDSQYFEVDSVAEAEALLMRAAELASEVSEQAVTRNVKRVRRGKKAVEPAVSISTDSPELKPVVDQYRERIQAIYRQMAVDAEIRELLRLKMMDDDEKDALFVLLH